MTAPSNKSYEQKDNKGKIYNADTINVYEDGTKPDESPLEIDWRQVGSKMLEEYPLRQHSTEKRFESDIYIVLGLIERKEVPRRSINQDTSIGQVYQTEEKVEITQKFEHQQFLAHIGLGTQQAKSIKNISIIGEPGAGKTTLLQNIAQEIYQENKGLAICISLASLEAGQSIEQYLEQKWLKNALPFIHKLAPATSLTEVPKALVNALAERFVKDKVWLLLDGLDEMKAASPVEALTTIEKYINSGYLKPARVISTCRLNVWDANLTNPLKEFDTYRTLEFTDSQRNEFIQTWFTNLKEPSQAEKLITKLNEAGRERLRDLVKSPLRLVLLCTIWELHQGELPDTKANFYQAYFPYFYNWKKTVRNLTEEDELQEKLHHALGKLALAGIESSSRYRLPRKLAIKEMGKEYFKLACELGWLNIVDRDPKINENIYAFFHPTFQEYFAACAVDNWDFFAPRNHVDKPVEGKPYRIFEAKWKEVILLWLGREDMDEQEKEQFIQVLVEFDDGCWDNNYKKADRGFYGYRAYCLAGAGVGEFKACSRIEKIVGKIVEWRLGSSKISNDLLILAEETLLEIHQSTAVRKLSHPSATTKDNYTRRQAASSLEQIGQGNETEIQKLVDSIATSKDERTRRREAERLGQIGQGNETAIKTLANLIATSEDEWTRRRAAKSLGQIDPGNQTAIQALADLIVTTEDEFTRRQAVDSLGQIGQGNQTAIQALVDLIVTTEDEFTHRQAAESLGQIGQGNETAIQALVDLIATTKDKETRWQAAHSLGKIGQGNQTAIQALVDLITSTKDKYTRRRAAWSLDKILTKPFMTIVVNALRHSLSEEAYSILWDCAQNLSYVDFYQAWHTINMEENEQNEL